MELALLEARILEEKQDVQDQTDLVEEVDQELVEKCKAVQGEGHRLANEQVSAMATRLAATQAAAASALALGESADPAKWGEMGAGVKEGFENLIKQVAALQRLVPPELRLPTKGGGEDEKEAEADEETEAGAKRRRDAGGNAVAGAPSAGKGKGTGSGSQEGKGPMAKAPSVIGAGGAFGGTPPPINAPPPAVLDTGNTESDAAMAGAQ